MEAYAPRWAAEEECFYEKASTKDECDGDAERGHYWRRVVRLAVRGVV